MKNVKKIYKSNMTFIETVYFCYGQKAYKNATEKINKCNEFKPIEKGGITELWKNNNGSYIVVIAVKKIKNIVQLKGLIVHEITHASDYIMRQNDFTDMEFRAYCNQAMYQSAIEWIDNKLASNRSTRED